MNHSTDYFRSLLFPNRVESIILPFVSLGPVACAITSTVVKYNYNHSVNRYTTLLTKFDNWVLCLYIATLPILLIDLVRFSTGMVINPWICSFSSYYDYFLIEIFLEVITIEAFFHYLFIRKQSDSIFLVIKENLLSRIILRSVMVVGICNISYKFYKKQKMPKAYYICAGETPPFITKDCDSHQDQYNVFTLILYILIYFIFSILILIEKRKISKSKDQQPRNEESKCTGLNLSGRFENNMNTERVIFFVKVIYATLMVVLTGIYEQYDAFLIQGFPGTLLAYWYHFFMLPLAVLVGIWMSMRRNEGLNSYMKRKLLWWIPTSRIDPSM